MNSRSFGVWAAGLAVLLFFVASQAGAITIYDATTGGGAVGSDLAATANWSITGTGEYADNIGGINDGGILAYQFVDDNLPSPGNGPLGEYDYSVEFPDLDTQFDLWSYTVNMKTLFGNGATNGAMQVGDADGVGRWLAFIYEDASGNLVVNDLVSPIFNLGANDGLYHDFSLRSNGNGTANLFFDDVDQGLLNFRAGDSFSPQLTIGAGSTGATGGWNLTKATFDVVAGPALTLELTIDRDSGNITLDNKTVSATNNIIGYSLLSNAGALDQAGWNQQSAGSQLADDDDDWTVLTSAGISTDLSESVLRTTGAGDGGNLVANTGKLDFGDVWFRSPFEDIAIELLLDDGTVLSSDNVDVRIEYVGAAPVLGDIAGASIGDAPDGDIDLVDWSKFKAGVNTDVSGLSEVSAYLAGDLNGDLAVDQSDYNLFVAAFNAANPLSLAQTIAGVPEPSSGILIAMGMAWTVGTRSRKRAAATRTRRFVTDPSVGGFAKTSGRPTTERHMMKRAYACLVALVATNLLGTSTALAVSDFVLGTYDADVGNPANAAAIQSPEEQGFSEWASTAQGQDPLIATQEGVVGNDNTNAWLNSDQSTTNPGYLIDMTDAQMQAAFDFGWRYEIVMTMIEGGHFTSFGVGDNNPWGLPTNARVGFAPSVAGDTISFNPVSGGGTTAQPTPAGTVGDFYRAVVTGDVQSATGTFSLFDFSDGSQVGATQNYTDWAGGNSLSSDRFSLQSGSSGGTGRVAQIHSMTFAIPAPDTLTLEVNTINGATRLINNADVSIDFNGYFVESETGQLSSGGWTSLESIDLDGNGTPDDGIGWEAFDVTDANFLAEGFLTGSTTLAPGDSLSLGSAYNPAVAGAGEVGDLSFKLTDAAGRTIPSSLFSTIDYVTESVFHPADLNTDGFVDGLDLGILLGNFNQIATPAGGELNMTDPVDGLDLGILLGAWNPPSSLSAAVIPEPSSSLLMVLGGLVAAAHRQRRRATRWRLARSVRAAKERAPLAVLLGTLLLVSSAAALENDRDYTLGDDAAEGAAADATVGAQTFDSAGTPGVGDLQDLNSAGGPVFRAVDGATGRPGAATGDLGIEFDGTNDFLYTPISMNAPAQMYNNSTFFPGPPPQIFPRNYAGIFAHGIQLWAKPTVTGTQQDVVVDSLENGIGITENDTWGLSFDNPAAGLLDSGVSVESTLDANGWAHVMQLAGFGDPVGGGSAELGALLVNGIAVRAAGGFYDPSATPLSIGASVTLDETDGSIATSENFYTGQLDNVRIFFWGDNSNELGDDGAPGGSNTAADSLNADGQDWGALNLNTDNDWIAQRLDSLAAAAGVGAIPDTDLDFDGDTDADDEGIFIANWRSENLVSGQRVGDWNSRQQGDFNYDGITDLADAFLIHDQLAPLGGLRFDLLGVNVPEPSSAVLAVLSVIAWAAQRRPRAV